MLLENLEDVILVIRRYDVHIPRDGDPRDPVELTRAGTFSPEGPHKVAVLSENLDPAVPVVPNYKETY